MRIENTYNYKRFFKDGNYPMAVYNSGGSFTGIYFYKFTEKDIEVYHSEKLPLPKDGGLYHYVKFTKTKWISGYTEDFEKAMRAFNYMKRTPIKQLFFESEHKLLGMNRKY